jgi:hypothetical protein
MKATTMFRPVAAAWLGLLLILSLPLQAGEFFVATGGDDAADGRTRATAFRTVQKGVDALAPGDTLTVLPGEYFGPVRRQGLGSADHVTVIRADIAGTVVLRGDVPVGDFRRVPDRRFTWVADLRTSEPVVAVQEVDTLTILQQSPNQGELEYRPGVFFHDTVAGKLYISPSHPAAGGQHHYTASLVATHGLYLAAPRRVVIEGIAVTGFNAIKEMPNAEFTLGSVWGIFLVDAKDCVIRHCRAWLNGQGIGTNSQAPGSGDNVIEQCEAWGNFTTFGLGDRGGLTLVDPRRDVIRHCTAYLNGHFGVNIRGAAVTDKPSDTRSLLEGNLAWGNGIDLMIKGGDVHRTDRCAGVTGSNSLNPVQCLFWNPCKTAGPDSIVMAAEKDIDPHTEFADPDRHDYRLQSNSRFRGSGPEGKDRGPSTFQGDVFFVKPDGNDASDGLSVAQAWKTLAHATQRLQPGQTLYLLPGAYAGGLTWRAVGRPDHPITVRGRGLEPVVIHGGLTLDASSHVTLERVEFHGPVSLRGGESLAFEHCRFQDADTCLQADGVQGLGVEHGFFQGFGAAAIATSGSTSGVNLQGNFFANRGGPALRLHQREALLDAGYNGYAEPAAVWNVAGRSWSLQESVAAGNRFATSTDAPQLAARGPFGQPLGPFRLASPDRTLRLIQEPAVHSVSATTANIEWMTSAPAACELAWGDTPECANTIELEVMGFGSYSLTGLQPGQTYYFQIRALRTPSEVLRYMPEHEAASSRPVLLTATPLTIRTLKADAAPATYYVTEQGDDAAGGLSREQAWRTLQRAADAVRPGDTVLIGDGRYAECVRLRATGAPDRPITFRCLPGQKVRLEGAGKKLNQAFVAAGKSHLRFDGLYFANFNREPLQGSPYPGFSAEFNLYHCRDIAITRCFSDGRDGYTARFIVAWFVDGLRIENCVTMNKMSGALWMIKCLNVRFTHNVIARPQIQAIEFHNDPSYMVGINGPTMFVQHNIFTDMLHKKAVQNAGLIHGSLDRMEFRNNCFQVRAIAPPERAIFGMTLAAYEKAHGATGSIFADPGFAGDPGPITPDSFSPDRMVNPQSTIDFNSFFPTNAQIIAAGIGLQPAAFHDFGFDRKPQGPE